MMNLNLKDVPGCIEISRIFAGTSDKSCEILAVAQLQKVCSCCFTKASYILQASSSAPAAPAGRRASSRSRTVRGSRALSQLHGQLGGGRPRPITLSEARSRLDRSRFSRPNTHFSAFFEIYKKSIFSRANFANFCKKLTFLSKFCKILQFFHKSAKILRKLTDFFAEFY